MSKFSLKSLTEGNALVYITPFLVVSALFNIFDPNPAKHQFGQLEVLGAFILAGYYLWIQIAAVYDEQKIGKKRIEAVICMVVGIFSAMILMAPLLTWQYVALYRASRRGDYIKPIAIVIVTLWVATGVFFYGTAKFTMDKMNASQTGLQESSMPTPSSLPQVTQ